MTSVGVGTGGEAGGGGAGPLVAPDGEDCALGVPGLGDRAGLAAAGAVAAAVGLVQSTTALTGVEGAVGLGAGGSGAGVEGVGESTGAAPMLPAPPASAGAVRAAGSAAGTASCQPIVTANGEPTTTRAIKTDLGESRTNEHRMPDQKGYGVFRNSEIR
ncbi:MAG: hypothetical protein QOH97_64 [Actinoplanes sp.]|nr:hypothetical protein [Actinoplanes sp.]